MHTIWIATGQNLYFLVAARVFLVAAHKHRADTSEFTETLTKRREKEPLGSGDG